MNILFITQLFPAGSYNKHTSGALKEFVLAWGKAGHKVKVIRPYFSYEKEPFPVKKKFQIDEIDIEFIKPLRIPLLKLSYFNNKKIIRGLLFKPDVVICHLYNSYFTFHRIAKMLNIPLVIGIHMSDMRISKNWFHRWHQQYIFKNAVAFACRSKVYQKLFKQQFPEFENKTFLALSGLPQSYLNQNPEIKRHSTIKIISVSWLIKRKQIDRVLWALSKIDKKLAWQYNIIGSGEVEDELKKQATELGISENVNFLGQKSRNQVIEELKQNDIFILPSYNETFGLVYLEAMACGCLTIGSEREGIDGIIQDGENGFLCDPSSYDSITNKLRLAMQLDEIQYKKIVKEGLKTISSFSIEKKASDYLKQIEKIL